jgi:hypothetical protein
MFLKMMNKVIKNAKNQKMNIAKIFMKIDKLSCIPLTNYKLNLKL